MLQDPQNTLFKDIYNYFLRDITCFVFVFGMYGVPLVSKMFFCKIIYEVKLV